MRPHHSFFHFSWCMTACALLFLATLSGCGQRGPLYFPTEPAAQERASLPESLLPSLPASTENTATTATN